MVSTNSSAERCLSPVAATRHCMMTCAQHFKCLLEAHCRNHELCAAIARQVRSSALSPRSGCKPRTGRAPFAFRERKSSRYRYDTAAVAKRNVMASAAGGHIERSDRIPQRFMRQRLQWQSQLLMLALLSFLCPHNLANFVSLSKPSRSYDRMAGTSISTRFRTSPPEVPSEPANVGLACASAARWPLIRLLRLGHSPLRVPPHFSIRC
jgi:hypothetical protein